MQNCSEIQGCSQRKLMFPRWFCPYGLCPKAYQDQGLLWVATCSYQCCCSLYSIWQPTGLEGVSLAHSLTHINPSHWDGLCVFVTVCEVWSTTQTSAKNKERAHQLVMLFIPSLSSKFQLLQTLHSTWQEVSLCLPSLWINNDNNNNNA